jgi:hypothetical protein
VVLVPNAADGGRGRLRRSRAASRGGFGPLAHSPNAKTPSPLPRGGP